MRGFQICVRAGYPKAPARSTSTTLRGTASASAAHPVCACATRPWAIARHDALYAARRFAEGRRPSAVCTAVGVARARRLRLAAARGGVADRGKSASREALRVSRAPGDAGVEVGVAHRPGRRAVAIRFALDACGGRGVANGAGCVALAIGIRLALDALLRRGVANRSPRRILAIVGG